MSIRSLAIVVLALVAGIALSVDWYLEGEREVRAETRGQRAEHLPLVAPEAAAVPASRITRRASDRTAPSRSGTAAARKTAAIFLPPLDGEGSSTALEPR